MDPTTRDRAMAYPEPILVAGLFRELHGHLLDLLRSLSPEDWHRPTVCSAWCVQDIASPLLDGGLRRLSIQRDGYSPPDPPSGFESHEALVAYLHRLNADWTGATRRLRACESKVGSVIFEGSPHAAFQRGAP